MTTSDVETAGHLVLDQPAPASTTDTVRVRVMRDMAVLGASRYVVFAVSFVVGLVQKRWLGPYLVGVWQALSLARQYLSYADLGVARGLERDLPTYYATNNPQLERVRDAGCTAIVALNVGLVFLAAAIGWGWLGALDLSLAWGLRLMAVVAVIEATVNALESAVLRSNNRFGPVSQMFVGSELLFAACSLPAIILWGVYGLVVSVLASLLLKLVLLRAYGARAVKVAWDGRIAWALWKFGFPLTMFVILFKVFDTVDRLALLGTGQLEAVGLYSVATMAVVMLSQLPLAISQVLFPRTIAQVASGASEQTARFVSHAQSGVLMAMILAVGGIGFVFPELVRLLLPEFVAGIPALKVGVWSMLFVGLVYVPIQSIQAVQGSGAVTTQWKLFAVGAVVGGGYYAASRVLLHRIAAQTTLLTVMAAGRVAAYAVLWLALALWMAWTLRSLQLARQIGSQALVCAYMILCYFVIDRLLPGASGGLGSGVARAAAGLGLLLAAAAPAVIAIERGTGLFQTAANAWREQLGMRRWRRA